jgi:Maltokinase N-terminal cap domain
VALIHQATLSPTKLELLQQLVQGRSWFTDDGPLEAVGAYRWDDPAGEVGIETHVVRSGGALFQLPVTYRAAELDGARLIGTTEHSVLGRRWVYEGCTDPVYVAALATALFTAAPQAELWYELDDGRERRDPSVRVSVDGDRGDAPAIDDVTTIDEDVTTLVRAGGCEFVVQRALGPEVPGRSRLTGTWAGQDEPVGLAAARA